MAVNWSEFTPVESSAPLASGNVDWSQFEPVKPSGDTMRGLTTAFQQVPQLAYGVAALGAAALETAFGEGGLSTAAKNWAVGGYKDWGAKIQSNAKDTDEFDVSWGRAKDGDYGALVDWLQYGIGYAAGQGVQLLASAGVGGLVGKATLRTAAEKFAGGMITKEAGEIAATEAGKQLTQEAIQKAAVAGVASKLGQFGAIGANAFGMEAGEIGGDLVSENAGRVLTGSEIGRAVGASIMAGGLEFAADALGYKIIKGDSLFGFKSTPGIIGKAARGATNVAVGAPSEFGTEWAQTQIEEFGKGKEMFTPEANRQALNAGMLGAVGGGVHGVVGGAMSRAQPPVVLDESFSQPKNAIQSIPEAGSVDQAIDAARQATDEPISVSPPESMVSHPAARTQEQQLGNIAADADAAIAQAEKDAQLDVMQSGVAPNNPPAPAQTATRIAYEAAQQRAQVREQARLEQESAAQAQTQREAAMAAAEAAKPQPSELPILEAINRRQTVSDADQAIATSKGYAVARPDGTLRLTEQGFKARSRLVRQAPLAPKTVAGVPVDSHTDDQLQALATDATAAPNTRHAAATALQARTQNPEAQSSTPEVASPILAPEASVPGIAPGQAAVLPGTPVIRNTTNLPEVTQQQQEAAHAPSAEPAAPITPNAETLHAYPNRTKAKLAADKLSRLGDKQQVIQHPTAKGQFAIVPVTTKEPSPAQIAARAAASERWKIANAARRRPNPAADSLNEWAAKRGGIHMSERSDTVGEGNKAYNGAQWLFRTEGEKIDALATRAYEAGYLTAAEHDDVDGGVQALKDKIAAEFNGQRKHYSAGKAEQGDQRTEEDVLTEDAGALGIDTQGLSLEQLREEIRKAQLPQEALLDVGLEPNVEDEAAIREMADALASLTSEETAQLDDEAGHLPEQQFRARVLQFVKDKQNATHQNGKALEGGETVGAEAQAAEPAASPTEEPLLTQPTPADLKARADTAQAEADKKAAEEVKAKADELRGGFSLTGSDRPADRAAAAGQQEIFSQPANTLSPADLLRAAAAKMDEAAKPATSETDSINGVEKINSAEQLMGLIKDNGGTIYVRWSSGPKYDMAPEARSRDYVAGQEHNGLSASPLTADMDANRLAKFIWEYMFLRMKRPVRPQFYSAERIGTDSDGYALIQPQKFLGTLSDKLFTAFDKNPLARTWPDTQSPGPPSEGRGVSTATNRSLEPAAKVDNAIDDFGEKIGGARKDTAKPLGERTKKDAEESAEPSWRKRFTISQIAASSQENEVGLWTIRDERKKDWLGQARQVGQTFASQEAAEKAIPLIAVAQKHRVVMGRPNEDGQSDYTIWRTVTDRKRVQVVNEQFATREDAMRHMAEHAVEIIETKTSFGEEILAKPDHVIRTGAERRTGPATAKMFSDAFGFRSVEFGNWNNQDERQAVMNHAYDGLLDLADVLNVPPKALSLNGDLSLAFGARGQGLSGAKAHYETDYGVINLTKMTGAGSLGHEWFHALDHYLGRQDTKVTSEKVKNEHGDMVYPDTVPSRVNASHGFGVTGSQVRPELRAAYTDLIQTMFTKAEQYVEDMQKAEKFVGASRGALTEALQNIRVGLTRGPEQLTHMKRNNRSASSEQLAQFDALAERLIAGQDLTTGFRYNQEAGGKAVSQHRAIMAGRHSNDTLDGISAVLKAVRGRSGFNAENSGPLDGLRYLMKNYAERIKMLDSANASETKTKRVPTSYAMENKRIDQGRASDYWTTEHEMAARAFSAYVEDKIGEQGNQSDFLSYGANNDMLKYRLLNVRPFPEGAERIAINQAFDKFVGELQTRETDKGVAMFSRAEQDKNYSPIVDPTKEEAEAVQSAIEGKSVIDAARFIAERSPSEDYRLIGKRVLNQLQLLRAAGMKFELHVSHVGDMVPGELIGTRGMVFRPNGSDVSHVWLQGADVGGYVGTSYETVLHELLHAATQTALYVGNRRIASGKTLAQNFLDLHDVSNAIVGHFNKKFIESGRDENKLTPFDRSIYLRLNNSVQNEGEVLAWALTNRPFQEYLEGVPYKSRSLWTSFVAAVRKFLGLPVEADTALSEVLRITDDLLNLPATELLDMAHQIGLPTQINRSGGLLNNSVDSKTQIPADDQPFSRSPFSLGIKPEDARAEFVVAASQGPEDKAAADDENTARSPESSYTAGYEVRQTEGRSETSGTPAATGQLDLHTASQIPGTPVQRLETVVVEPERIGKRKVAFARIRTAGQAANVFQDLNRSPRERFQALGLDKNDKPIAFFDLFAGTVSQTSVYPRELWSVIYQTPGIKSVWIAHQHPSGIAEASNADRTLTKALQSALTPDIGVTLRGHLVIAKNATTDIGPDGNQNTRIQIEPGEPRFTLPIIERVVVKQETSSDPLSSPAAVRAFFRNLKPGETGVIVMDPRHRPIGWWPMSIAQMSRLRTGDVNTGMAALMRAVGRSNAAAAIAYAPPGTSQRAFESAAQNVGEALSLADVRMLDIIVDDGATMLSLAERGENTRTGTTFLSRAGFDTGIKPEDARAVAEKHRSVFRGAPPVHVLENVNQAPTELLADIERAGAQNDVAGAWHNGEIYLFAGHLKSVEHAGWVLLHEATHHGLRGVLGSQLDPLLLDIYASNEGFRAKVKGRMSKEGLSTVRAAEEVLADMGADNLPRGVMQKIVAAVRNLLRRMGLVNEWKDGDIRALVADALGSVKKPTKMHWMRGTALSDSDQTQTPEDSGSRFARNLAGVTGAWNAPEASKMDSLIYTLQDKQIDTRRVLQAIRAQSIQVSDAKDAYLQEELFHGRAAKATQDFIDVDLKPLITEMAARGVTMQEFEEYLHARHAEEANIAIAARNPNMPDGGSGMETQDARDYLANLPANKKRAYEALAVRVDSINDSTRQMIVDYQLESQETIDEWKAAYQNYVPLHREDVGSGIGIGQGFSVRGPASKMRKGSSRTVVDILANIAMQREKTIVRGEKNVVSTALYGLAKANPNPEFWTLAKPGITTSISAETGDPVDVVDMSYQGRDNVVMSRAIGKDGKIVQHGVEFNQHNERALRMAMALKNLDANQMGEILSASAKVTRYFAAVNTQYNPIFGVVNLTRDSQQAMFNLSTTPIAGRQAEVAKHILSALKGIYLDLRASRQGGHPNSAWAQLFDEFQNEGGQTGYRDMFRTSEDRAEAIQRELDRVTEGKAKQFGRAVFNWLSDYNTAMENAVRLSAYKVGKESGMTNQRAASMAKNLTVNFNRKGEITTQAGALYAFFNASVQGTTRLAETLAGPTGRKIIVGGITLGAIQALMLAAAGFDDDEPPQFIRERSLIIPIGEKKYLTIPMPLGLHFIPNIGRLGTEFALSGFRDPGKRVMGLINAFADAFNPVGSAGLSLQTVSPTIFDPLAALAENKDWTGKPIARQDMSQLSPTPGHTRAKDTASAFSKTVSKALNYASGGTAYKPGLFSPTPDQIDYLIGQATGGIGREAMKAEQSVASVFTGEELPSYKIPLLGRFYGNAEQQSSQGNAFYSHLKDINEHEAEIKGRRKAGEPIGDYFKDNPEARLIQMANATERRVSELRKRKRELLAKDASTETIQVIDLQITARMKQFNDRVKQVSASAP